ncbi:MAG: hypothetical protein KFF77_03715 [Bacteroidetes bacterium]|nr:hypothetical protein [Bacteroidota bacterium]
MKHLGTLLALLPMVALMLALTPGCDTTEPYPPPSITITQPADSAVIDGDVLRILTETSSQCGCDSHVEFYVDGTHVYSHYQPFYYYDWDIRAFDGEHVIRARLVMEDVGEANDSVRVFIRR